MLLYVYGAFFPKRHTGVPTDVAVQGDTYFMVRRGEQNLLTRSGNFMFNSLGQLTTTDGYPVLNEDGALTLPPEAIGNAKPHARFVLRQHGGLLVLQPEGQSLPFWMTATPLERAERFRQWANQERPDAPVLPLEALSRESIYE